ncbi:MAG: hypothetical protein IKQ97_01975 [Eubacterium sp.]|nr:hypothetical protein [Eubacterium sp.]
MKNAITADLIRIQKKKSFIILLIIELVLIIGCALITMFVRVTPSKDVDFLSLVSSMAGMSSLIVGLPIFLAVFSDDFRSHAMQTAIGFGLSRSKLIVARYIEVFLLFLEATVFMVITELLMGLAAGVSSSTIVDTCNACWQYLVPTMCYMAICLLIVYSMRSATFAMVCFIIFTVGVLDEILAGISVAIPFLRDNNIHLNYALPDTMVGKLAINPAFDYRWAMWIVVVVVYVLLPIWLATRVFRKKELEF